MERKDFKLSKVRIMDNPNSFGKVIQGLIGEKYIGVVISEEEYNKMLEDYLYSYSYMLDWRQFKNDLGD